MQIGEKQDKLSENQVLAAEKESYELFHRYTDSVTDRQIRLILKSRYNCAGMQKKNIALTQVG